MDLEARVSEVVARTLEDTARLRSELGGQARAHVSVGLQPCTPFATALRRNPPKPAETRRNPRRGGSLLLTFSPLPRPPGNRLKTRLKTPAWNPARLRR